MKSYSNIEKSAFNRQYVGYSKGGDAWRITGQHGNWTAVRQGVIRGRMHTYACYDTLQEISDLLSATE